MPSLTIYPNVSPRLIFVEPPDTVLTAQELINGVRTWEMLPPNHSYAKIIGSASGKEPLGGSVFVGITVRMDDGKVAFVPDTASVSSGTVTTPDTTGVTLIDSGADFISDGVEPGATLINFTDQSVATVLRVVDLNTLECLPLDDGSDNQFDSSDAYKIWNVQQTDLTGGNVTAIDDVGDDASAILPTAFTQVVRTSSSSATLQELATIEHGSFEDKITIDSINGHPGTGRINDEPIGTPKNPSNNVLDAFAIRAERGFKTVSIVEDLTLTADANVQALKYIGRDRKGVTVTVDTAADVLKCHFEEMTLLGVLDGNSTVINCDLSSLNYIDGHIENCILNAGTILLAPSTVTDIIKTQSGVTGISSPIIDCNGTGEISMRGHIGGCKAINYTGSGDHSIDLAGGQFILDSATITGGTWAVRGEGKLVDENNVPIATGSWNGGVTIVNETSNYLISLVAPAVWASIIEAGYTAEGLLKVLSAVLAGKVSGGGTGTEVFRDINDTKDRIIATTDSSGNRTAIVVDDS